jgi:hypothetical protein
MRLLLVLLLIRPMRADELTDKMAARVSQEAEAFQALAPQVLGQETLHQRSMKPPPRFRPRVGDRAKLPPKPEYQERTIVSQYGFASFSDGEPGSLHEIRQVTSVDGKKIEEARKARTELAQAIAATGDEQKRALLRRLEKYGLLGAVTDYGQALLLFTRRNMAHFALTFKGMDQMNGQNVEVFAYRQIAAPGLLTLVEEKKKNRVLHLQIEGELWVRSEDFVPVRIVMTASRGPSGDQELDPDQAPEADQVKEDATIDYAMSAYGALLPLKTEHRETRGGTVAAENDMHYSDFKKFGASSDITFDTDK